MKTGAKRALELLPALDFKLDHEDRKIRTDRWIFTHANDPEQRLIINYRMSEAAASKVIRHAEAIVGLASTETDAATKRAARDAEKKRREEADRKRRAELAEQRAAEKERQAAATRRRQFAARQRRGQLTNDDRLAILSRIRGEWIDPLRIADELCVREETVRAAINSGRLDAYRVGKRVLCKTREVVAWVKSGMGTEAMS